MNQMIFQSCEQITPDRLTAILQTNGAMENGRIATIHCDTSTYNKGFVSNVVSLHLTYSADATGTRPSRLFLKMSKPDVHRELLNSGRHEVTFYQAMRERPLSITIPRCYSAEVDPHTHQSHILMEDLSLSHFQKPLPIPPSNRHCEMMIESLAKLHTLWWNHPSLGNGLGERLTPEKAMMIRRRLENTLSPFLDFLGDAFLPQQRRAYEQIFASSFLDRRTERLCHLQNMTLIHGDAHTGNMMLPNDVENGRVALIDWHLWDINTAAIDLAFLIALHWSPQRRAHLEKPLLQRYHHTLAENGVSYSWEALWQDYREAVIVMTLIPIGQFRRGSPTGAIWFGLQDSMAAFHDLNCQEVL